MKMRWPASQEWLSPFSVAVAAQRVSIEVAVDVMCDLFKLYTIAIAWARFLWGLGREQRHAWPAVDGGIWWVVERPVPQLGKAEEMQRSSYTPKNQGDDPQICGHIMSFMFNNQGDDPQISGHIMSCMFNKSSMAYAPIPYSHTGLALKRCCPHQDLATWLSDEEAGREDGTSCSHCGCVWTWPPHLTATLRLVVRW